MRNITLVALGLVAAASACNAHASNCRAYSARLSYNGKLAIGESKHVTQWHSPRDGAINASAAKGRLTLLVQDGGAWREIKTGISTIFPRLPSGTYRLIVSNPYGIPTDYKVSLKYGTG